MEPLGVYVHIPFCVKKCRYCDFLSGAACRADRHKYLQALYMEIESRREELQSYKIRSVFVGGGTPSLLEAEEFTQLAKVLKKNTLEWDPQAEWTVESNPGTITPEKAAAWLQYGVNRVSMGMQASQDGLLKQLGRIHTYEQVETGVKILRQAGFTNINLDLMMGLPGQSLADWKETLEKAVALQPEHLSCYSLILEEGTPLYEDVESGRLHLPDEETDRAMYEMTLNALASAGYEQYEISNFAKAGYACKHNLSYWDLSEYRGLGMGASSYIKGCRIQNTFDMEEYNTVGPQEHVEEEASIKDAMEEWMFLGMRRTAGVSRTEFAQRFGCSMESVYGEVINKLLRDGLVENDKDRLRLSRRGLDLANVVFEAFLL